MEHKIKILEEDLAAYKKRLASVASSRSQLEKDLAIETKAREILREDNITLKLFRDNLQEKLDKIKAIAQDAKCEDVCPDQCYSAKQILEIIEGE